MPKGSPKKKRHYNGMENRIKYELYIHKNDPNYIELNIEKDIVGQVKEAIEERRRNDSENYN